MNFTELYRTLKRTNYQIFSTADIQTLYPNETTLNLKKLLYRWRKQRWILPLKKGLYELSYPQDLNIPDLFAANKIYTPSYVSLETALSYYSIIPEVSMAVTSITTKPTRRFKNHHGLFTYRTVNPAAFAGYTIVKYRDYEILMAEPEKALVDYLYFKTYSSRRDRTGKISFADERLDRQAIRQMNTKKLNAYARLYGREFDVLTGHRP
ncbi:MAG: hypothetical protein HY762_03890 [Planctomycetes bacterium]|nr:hypothetical protein [Planctomycetota bacterium]